MRILPEKPIHGLRFAQVERNALVAAGYIFMDEERVWRVSEEYWDLTDEELEELMQDWLRKRDR
ncbi:MAG: hypothetical protein JO250_23815 [Armatimonadetes bacterium]|nr:hypothetical protein [Armatimonadota bacterium]